MALRLFEHNEKAHHAAIRMMEQYGKAPVVHPTGTGKSYIEFKLIEDNSEKVVIWLSPSEYIFKTQLESLKKLCPKAKLLGLTTTNIRYLDNNCDMAEELFNGHIAIDMTLGEVVVRGILPAPKYVTTVYQYQKALAKYQARVDKWEKAYALAAAYYEENGNLNIPRSYVTAAGERLGQWVASQQWAYPKGKLTDEQVERLNRIGMYWGDRNDRQWNEGYQEAKRYFDAHGDLNVPAEYVSPSGHNLGNWVKRQRYTRQNPEKSCAVLTEERIEKLDAIGMRWEKVDSRQHRLELAQGSKRKSENLNVSANHKTGEDVGLCG